MNYEPGTQFEARGHLYTVVTCNKIGNRGYNVAAEDENGWWWLFWFPTEGQS